MCYFISAHTNEKTDWAQLRVRLQPYLSTVEMLPAIPAGYVDAGTPLSFHFTGYSTCDCDSPLDRQQITPEIETCFDALNGLQVVPCLKYLAILRHWHNRAFEFEEGVHYQAKKHIDELQPADLANLKDDVFLKILYYRQHWQNHAAVADGG